MINKKTIDDIDAAGKRVLLRCDFNVPIKDGKITDDTRIVAALPTIKKLMADGARLIICSHLGKPGGEYKQELSLEPVADRLSEILGKEVKFAADKEVVGENAKKITADLKDGEVCMIENVRFRPEETKNEEEFSKELASLCDIYVGDAFGTSHRAHCSVAGICDYVDSSAMGYLMEREINYLCKAIDTAKRPFVSIIGGAKVSSKISVIENLLDKVDKLIIGGGMAFTFIKALGGEIGKSLVEDEYLDYAKKMVDVAKEKGVEFLLPVDMIVTKEFSNDAPSRVADAYKLEPDEMGLDIGPKTQEIFAKAIKGAKTVIWNGPMGVFEFPNFSKGTFEIAEALAELKCATTIVGGGDSAAAIKQLGFSDRFSHISTGGGASLEILEGKCLPGVEAVDDKCSDLK